MNILNQFEANDFEKDTIIDYFKTHTVSHNAVVDAIKHLRTKN
jgi:hydroxymethylglutaryl-CoA reductase